ncbi:MAG: hypothetical protein KAR47_07335 [Planctomycetes bacterium]|nr:hypothetical protein [Planctomycetota bacterium]
MNQTPQEKKTMPWWRRLLLAAILLAMVVTFTVIGLNYHAGKLLGDEVIKISNAGEPLSFSDLDRAEAVIDKNKDAAAYYQKALTGIDPDSLEGLKSVNGFYRKNMHSLPPSQFPKDLRDQVVQQMAPLRMTLVMVDQASTLPMSTFDLDLKEGREPFQQKLTNAQTITLLLSLRTLEIILDGRSDIAAESAIIMLKTARIYDSYPTITMSKEKTVCLGLVCDDIKLLLELTHPSDNKLKKVQDTLTESVADDAFANMLLAERVYYAEFTRNMVPQKIADAVFGATEPSLQDRFQVPSSFLARFRMRKRVTNILWDLSQLIGISRQPWPDVLDTTIRLAKNAKTSHVLLSRGQGYVELVARNHVAVRCTALAVAIERYRRDHEDLPDTLDELVGDYVESIGQDPYTGGSLLYHRDDDGYVVYSAGINRIDDRGAITPDAGEKSARDRGVRISFRDSAAGSTDAKPETATDHLAPLNP